MLLHNSNVIITFASAYKFYSLLTFSFMKHKGNCREFNRQRDKELTAAFHRILLGGGNNSIESAFFNAASSPASRFWVSERRAAYVVGQMLANPSFCDSMIPKRKEMFEEIFRRFLAVRKKHPSSSIYALVFDIVNSRAPEFYLTPKSSRVILYKAMKRKNID